MNPAEQCKFFIRCAYNACPLDYSFLELEVSPLDPEQRCKATKEHRLSIAENYPDLPTRGMTKHEFAYFSMPCETKAKILQNTKKNRFKPVYKTVHSKNVSVDVA